MSSSDSESSSNSESSSDSEVEISATPQNKVNEKPLIATGELTLYFSPEKFTKIDKLFGVVKKNNEVLQFRVIISGSFSFSFHTNSLNKGANFDLELVYMSQEPIDCDLEFKTKVRTFLLCDNLFGSSESRELGQSELRQEQNPPGVLWAEKKENMSTFSRRFVLKSPSYGSGFYLTIVLQIGQDGNAHENSEMINCASKFNNFSTSDFKVVCQDTVFHVHQQILEQKSEYFAALLRNDCLENQKKELNIEDFEPKTIEMLLRYIYNGTICLSRSTSDNIEKLKNLMLIADKYNFKELFKTCDSYLAQWHAFMLNLFSLAANGPGPKTKKIERTEK